MPGNRFVVATYLDGEVVRKQIDQNDRPRRKPRKPFARARIPSLVDSAAKKATLARSRPNGRLRYCWPGRRGNSAPEPSLSRHMRIEPTAEHFQAQGG